MIDLLKRYKKTGATFLIFVVYSAALLWAYYDAQGKLREDVLNEIRLETEKQAAAISYFFAERRNDLADIAASPEVGNFFANRDLGMSYEYGLGLNVQAIESRFDRLLAQKRLGAAPIYRDLVLIDSDDQVIAPQRSEAAPVLLQEALRGTTRVDTTVVFSADRKSLYFVAPVWLKGAYRGQVIASGSADIFGGLVSGQRRNLLATRVVATAALPDLQEGVSENVSPAMRDAINALVEPGDRNGTSVRGNADLVAVIRVGIGNAPFSLIALVTGQHASGRSTPLLFLIAAALVPLLVLVLTVTDAFERRRLEEMNEAARLEAERLARLRSEFVANMSHEIRTPLNGILGLAQIGYRNNVGRSEVQDTFLRIVDSGRLLLGIVNDVLDFSKIEAGKLVLEQTPFHLGQLIDEVVALHSERAVAKGIEMIIDRAADMPSTCLGDPVRVAQVLNNLMANAIKFTESGRVTLTTGRENDSLTFKVADSGIGMSASQLARLFAPFEQADSSTTRRFGGTGLGLAITKRLIDAMGGTLRIESELGVGTTFDVSLPYLQVPEEVSVKPIVPAPPADHPRLSGVAILVAEDNEVNRLILEDMLSAEGAKVVLVENGKQAVAEVSRKGNQAFDLVLMDIQMPEMDGYEATRQILAIAPDLPVVAQTAHALPGELERCRAAGMADQLTKPIEIERLVAIVRRHARRRADSPSTNTEPPPSRPEGNGGEASTIIDWNALDNRYRNKPEFLKKLMVTATDSLAQTPGKLRMASQSGDVGESVFLAHNLKGVAGNLMANGLARQAADAELACRNGSTEAVARLSKLADAVEAMLKEIAERQGA